MNKNTLPAVSALSEIELPDGARAVLLTKADNGKFNVWPVEYGESILNIDKDLTDHLDSKPYSTDWLLNLRHYIDQRLKARGEAATTGGIAMARGDGWNIMHFTQINGGA